MPPTLHSSFRTNIAFYQEPTQGAVPGAGDTPAAQAIAWAAAEGADAFRVFVEEGDPAFIRGAMAVPNADMQENVYTKQPPHKGLPTADGGTLLSRVWGTGDSWGAGLQVLGGTPSGLGRILAHALGGSALGGYTDIATVADALNFGVTTAAFAAVGHLIWIEDADDPGRLFPVQITGISGTDFTIDRELPFAPDAGDKIYGMEMAWPDAEALTNPSDVNYSTYSILYEKGPHVWLAGGSHLELTELQLERGQQPKFAWAVLSAKGVPQGDGSPDSPVWTGGVEGLGQDVKAVGHDTLLYINDVGTTTWSCTSVFEAKLTAGVPVRSQDSVTECESGMPGRAGYMTEPADTTLEVVVPLTDDQQARWTAGTIVTVTYFQVAPVGFGYCVHIAKGFLMDAPEPVLEGTNRWRLMIQATHNDDATTETYAAKFVLGR